MEADRKSLVRERFDSESELWRAHHEEPVRGIVAWEVRRRKEIARDALVARLGGRAARVLEVGCGAGDNLREMLEADTEWSGMGVDISPGMVQHCRERFADDGRMSFEVLDVDSRALDERFDGIILMGVVGYLDSTRRAMEHIHAMLRPGGVVVFTYGKKPSVSRAVGRTYGRLRRRVKPVLARLRGREWTAPESHFLCVRDREIREAVAGLLEVREVHHIAFSSGLLKRAGVAIGRVLERVFGRWDPLRLAQTGVIVAERAGE